MSPPLRRLDARLEDFDGHRSVVVRWHPARPPRAQAVFFPAFGDEMNQACRMIKPAAEALAARGIGSVVFDLHGTGDSSARSAAVGHACLRFDYTGKGDSPGPRPDFEKAEPDIGRGLRRLAGRDAGLPAHRAVGTVRRRHGSDLLRAKGPAHRRGDRSQSLGAQRGHARAGDRERALRVAAQVAGVLEETGHRQVNVLVAGKDAVGNLQWARGAKAGSGSGQASESLPDRLARALASPASPARMQLSGKDLTAAEFEIAMRAASIDLDDTALRLSPADHMFSEPDSGSSVIDDVCQTLRFADKGESD